MSTVDSSKVRMNRLIGTYRHNCIIHGQIRELDLGNETDSGPDSTADENSDDTSDETSDEGEPAHHDECIGIEKVINYKVPMKSTSYLVSELNVRLEGKPKPHPPGTTFNKSWWLNKSTDSKTHKITQRKPFYPCDHAGNCEQAQCGCYQDRVTCEKSCRCSQACNRRFPGCDCAMVTNGRPCRSDKCLCKKYNRECDADLCGTCGAAAVLDPVNRRNEDILQGRCSNVAIQRNVPKKTLLGHSTVHGLGLYAGEYLRKDDFIQEYVGEVITIAETNRREIIYQHQNTMYTFNLNASKW